MVVKVKKEEERGTRKDDEEGTGEEEEKVEEEDEEEEEEEEEEDEGLEQGIEFLVAGKKLEEVCCLENDVYISYCCLFLNRHAKQRRGCLTLQQ